VKAASPGGHTLADSFLAQLWYLSLRSKEGHLKAAGNNCPGNIPLVIFVNQCSVK
jgi:hypothetical protein